MDNIVKKTSGTAIHSVIHQQTGRRHILNNASSEDTVYVRKTSNLVFYGIADGKTGTKHGAEGGYACLGVLADFIEHHTIQSLIESNFPDEVPYKMMQEVRKCILSLSSLQKDEYDEYASTLLAIALDPVTSQYIIMHLGDGCVIGVNSSNTLSFLSRPDNGISKNHTWLTTSKSAITHFRITYGSVYSMKRLLLMSDGTEGICCGSNLLHRAKELVSSGTGDEIAHYLSKSTPEDDASCIVLDFLFSQ